MRATRVAARLFPASVVVVEARRADWEGGLLPEEELLVAPAVEKRRREFTAGRNCARTACGLLGIPPVPLLSGPKREPLWPDGVVGSITHSDDYCAAVVARSLDAASLGIDAEVHEALADRVGDVVLNDAERAWIASIEAATGTTGAVNWDRVIFSAKESVYKAWFPLAGRWLGFEEALITVEPSAGTFRAELLVDGPVVDGRQVRSMEGRFALTRGMIFTGVLVRPSGGTTLQSAVTLPRERSHDFN